MIPPTEISAGRIVGLFGLRGECKIDASRVGNDSLDGITSLEAALADGSRRTLTIASMRRHKGRPLVIFDGYGDATTADVLVGATLFVDRAAAHVGAGEYLDVDLVGCRVVDQNGVDHGTVSAVEHFPAQDMLVVGPAKTLVPLVSAFVISIEPALRLIRVDVPRGLFDDREAERDEAGSA